MACTTTKSILVVYEYKWLSVIIIYMLGILKRMAKFEKRINAIWSEIFCNKNNVSIHHILTAKKIAVIL